MVEFLADRYIAWVSFLYCTAWDTRPLRHPGKLAIFSASDGLASGDYTTVFRADELKLYSAQGQPCLSLPGCVADFRCWMQEIVMDYASRPGA